MEKDNTFWIKHTRPFKLSDLPEGMTDGRSLRIPVIYEGQLRYIADKNFANPRLCYLEEQMGERIDIIELRRIEIAPIEVAITLNEIEINCQIAEREHSINSNFRYSKMNLREELRTLRNILERGTLLAVKIGVL